MEILNIQHISKSFGITQILDDVSFSIMEGDKIGMMGVNGAGKTTLFKVILGELEQDGGTIIKQRNLKIGYMPQQTDYRSDKTAYEDTLSVFAHFMQMELRMEELQQKMDQQGDEESIHSFSALQERYIQEGGLLYKGKARSMLLSLGLTEEEMDLQISLLSGGQRTRVLLAKLLLSEPDILMLDEPTNHLDIAAVEWLEGFLREYRGAVLVISHDRYFLDKFVSRIFELENRRLTTYKGNYSDFVRLKEEARIALERDYEKKTRELKRVEGIIAQQKQWNTERSVGIARHKQKMADRIAESIVRPEDAPKSMHITLNSDHRSGNDVLLIDNVGKSFDGQVLFTGASFLLKRGDRAFLLGRNGIGKSTLFKLILGEIPLEQGDVKFGSRVEVGYYAQGQEKLPLDKSILEAVYMNTDEQSIGRIRDVLAAFLFRGEDVDKQIDTLSGGEKARVALAILMLSGCNLLMLDEPTNHLDIPSREILEDALMAYEGTILAISHDRYFIKKLATRMLDLDKDKVTPFEGGYEAYLENKEGVRQLSFAKKEEKEKDAGALYRQKRSEEAEKRKKQSRFQKLERMIAQLEESIETQKARLYLPDVAADYAKVLEISQQIGNDEQLLQEYYDEWEVLAEQI